MQFILRLHEEKADVVNSFDVDCCGVLFDGEQVFATPRARRAIITRTNVAVEERRSWSYETRLLKYARRGFAVCVPGLDWNNLRLDLSNVLNNSQDDLQKKYRRDSWRWRVKRPQLFMRVSEFHHFFPDRPPWDTYWWSDGLSKLIFAEIIRKKFGFWKPYIDGRSKRTKWLRVHGMLQNYPPFGHIKTTRDVAHQIFTLDDYDEGPRRYEVYRNGYEHEVVSHPSDLFDERRPKQNIARFKNGGIPTGVPTVGASGDWWVGCLMVPPARAASLHAKREHTSSSSSSSSSSFHASTSSLPRPTARRACMECSYWSSDPTEDRCFLCDSKLPSSPEALPSLEPKEKKLKVQDKVSPPSLFSASSSSSSSQNDLRTQAASEVSVDGGKEGSQNNPIDLT